MEQQELVELVERVEVDITPEEEAAIIEMGHALEDYFRE